MNERGKYIVIEGNDGTGKSTQVDELAKYFCEKGREVVIIEEPGSDDPEKSTPRANYLRGIIKDGSLKRDPEINLALLSAARGELWREKIAPALGRGAVVLAARNYKSTEAYQGYGEGLDVDHIRKTTELFTCERYMNPDITIILTLGDEAERARRINARGELQTPDTFESREDAFQARVNAAYREIAERENLPVVDCMDGERRKTVAEITAEIIRIVERELARDS